MILFGWVENAINVAGRPIRARAVRIRIILGSLLCSLYVVQSFMERMRSGIGYVDISASVQIDGGALIFFFYAEIN